VSSMQQNIVFFEHINEIEKNERFAMLTIILQATDLHRGHRNNSTRIKKNPFNEMARFVPSCKHMSCVYFGNNRILRIMF